MKYENMVLGVFIRRPNRFIAHVLIDGQEEIVHVKTPGGAGNCSLRGQRYGVSEAATLREKQNTI